MGQLDLKDLEKIERSDELMELLIDEGIIKEKKFIKQIEYERELHQLQYRLLQLQSHIVEQNKRLLVIFEGRDAAGKGGSIQRCVSSLNPKKYRVTALSKPTDLELSQWYFQRYFLHLPNAGEMVFFDRSWYNRAVVEPVFGFCTEAQHDSFMTQVNKVEKLLEEEGIVLIKIFLSISKEEQKQRLDERKSDPMKQWKIGGLDKMAQEKWDNYSHYISKMLNNTHKTPWAEIVSDSKKEARLQAIRHILSHFPELFPDINADKKIVKIHA